MPVRRPLAVSLMLAFRDRRMTVFHNDNRRHRHDGGRRMETVRMTAPTGTGVAAFLAARDFLLRHREDYDTAYRDFRWPQLGEFNWALDHFDAMARGNDAPALWIVDESGSEDKVSFARMSE